jgi:sulfite exporter TauE/SafE
MIIYWAAIASGLIGSLHCAGMCGPISLAIPMGNGLQRQISGIILYNTGRALTYGTLGYLAGSFGHLIGVGTFGKWLSFLAGTGFILYVLIAYIPGMRFGSPGRNIAGKFIRKPLQRLFKMRGVLVPAGVGMLNGLLPCGLVYAALTASFALATPGEGGIYMILFGLGTMPGMLALYWLGNRFRAEFSTWSSRLLPAFLIVLGVLFILRSEIWMNSRTNTQIKTVEICH